MRTPLTQRTAVIFTAFLAILSGTAYGGGSHYVMYGFSDSAATVVVPSPPAPSVTLTGTLHRGYVTPRVPAFVHGHEERIERYLFLHLDRPIDVFMTDRNDQYTYPVVHQYDVQVVGPTGLLDSLVSHCVTITGSMPPAGNMAGASPDWQPFPLTIYEIKAISPANAVNGRCMPIVQKRK